MKSKPHDFLDKFRPFLNNKTKDARPIFLKNKHEDGIIEDQKQVAETLANYFSSNTSDIDSHVIRITENEFNNHSVFFISIQTRFENLNSRKCCSYTGLIVVVAAVP